MKTGQIQDGMDLLKAANSLGNLNEAVLFVDSQSDKKDRIVEVLGEGLRPHTTFFSNENILESLTDGIKSKPVLIFSTAPWIREFAE